MAVDVCDSLQRCSRAQGQMMSLDDHLIHTCTISRNVDTTTDEYGNTLSNFKQIASGVRCRFVEGTQRIFASDTASAVYSATYKLILPAGTDLEQGDCVVVTLDGAPDPRTFSVDQVLTRRARCPHHLSARLSVVNG